MVITDIPNHGEKGFFCILCSEMCRRRNRQKKYGFAASLLLLWDLDARPQLSVVLNLYDPLWCIAMSEICIYTLADINLTFQLDILTRYSNLLFSIPTRYSWKYPVF